MYNDEFDETEQILNRINKIKQLPEFKNAQKSMRKKHDCRVVEFDYKYFNGVNENEID